MEIYSHVQQFSKPVNRKKPTAHTEEKVELPILPQFERQYSPEAHTPGQPEPVELPVEVRQAAALAAAEAEKQRFEAEDTEPYKNYIGTLPEDHWERKQYEKNKKS